MIEVTQEMIEPWRRDVVAEIQAFYLAAYFEKEKAELAAVTSPEFAEWAYGTQGGR